MSLLPASTDAEQKNPDKCTVRAVNSSIFHIYEHKMLVNEFSFTARF